MVAAWRSRPRRGTGAGNGAGTGLRGPRRSRPPRPRPTARPTPQPRPRPGQQRKARPETAAESEAETAAAGDAPESAPRRKSRSRRTDAERSLRGIVGAGSSQVGVVGAMRARDAARPTAEDLAAAERDLVIVRRHYVPPGTLPGAR